MMKVKWASKPAVRADSLRPGDVFQRFAGCGTIHMVLDASYSAFNNVRASNEDCIVTAQLAPDPALCLVHKHAMVTPLTAELTVKDA